MLLFAARKQAAKNGGVQGLDSPIEDAGIAGERLDRRDGDAEFLDVGLGAAGAVKLHAQVVKSANNGFEAVFRVDGDERRTNLHREVGW